MHRRALSNLLPVPFVVATLRRLAPAGATVLDIGCGPALYRDVLDCRYIGLDVSDEPYGDVPRAVDLLARAERIPLGNASVDLAFCLSTLYQCDDPDAVLREMHRVVRPGGQIAIFDYNRRTQRRLRREEGGARPCWTQWGLRDRVARAGFGGARVLAASDRQPRGAARWARLVTEELRGQWAIVAADR